MKNAVPKNKSNSFYLSVFVKDKLVAIVITFCNCTISLLNLGFA
jgi:hypothetical protein